MRLIQWIPKKPSKIAIVGEAPGREENIQGNPFVGPEGKYLTKLLSLAGITKSECYVTNVVHQQPPKNEFDRLPQQVKLDGERQLAKDIDSWKPNVIIAVGAKALSALTDRSGIFKYRGAVIESSNPPGYKVFPTLHPGNLIKGNPKYEPIVIHDLKNALEESKTPEINYPERNIKVIEDIVDAEAILQDFTDYPHPLAIDIESIGTNGIMTAYGFAASRSQAYVIGMNLLKSPRVLRAISKMANSSTPKIFHNALFDALHGAYFYKIFYRNIFCDTMLAQHAAMPVFPKSLGFCASIYTQEPYWKDETGDEDKANRNIRDWDQHYIYNGKDCCLTYEVYESVMEQINYYQSQPAYDLMMSLVYPCLRALYAGTLIDPDAILEFSNKNEKIVENLEKIKMGAIGDINVNSPPQKKKLLYEDWGLPKQYKDGKVATGKHAIEYLERFSTPQRPLLGLINELVKYKKRREFYNLKLDPDGRIRTALKIHGTYTGRMASSKSITGSGRNLQNIPKDVRHFYVPDPGKIFIQMDLSQAEARVVAALCKDEQWLKEFDTTDLHSKVASQLYSIPMDQVRKNVERMTAKRVAHASHYLLGWKLLSSILKCSAKEAKRHKATYFDIRPKLYDWHDQVKKIVRKDKMIQTCFGRTIQFPGPPNDKTFRDATAAEPQSTSGDYLNQAIKKMYWEGPKEFEFQLQVHDSILFQVPNQLDAVVRNIQVMKELTEIEVNVRGVPLVIPCDFEIGFSWGKMTELKSTDKKEIEKVYNEIQ